MEEFGAREGRIETRRSSQGERRRGKAPGWGGKLGSVEKRGQRTGEGFETERMSERKQEGRREQRKKGGREGGGGRGRRRGKGK